jgi:phage-related minor tail protein
MSGAFTQMATGAEVDFNRILASFINMLAQMAAQAAVASVFKMGMGMMGGAGGTGGGLLDGLFTMIMGSPFGFAEGGDPPVGRASLVGEKGPELFVPKTAGTIWPTGTGPGGSDGGSIVVNVNQTVNVGEFVTSTQYLQGLSATRKAAQEGAVAALLGQRRSGDRRVKGVFG